MSSIRRVGYRNHCTDRLPVWPRVHRPERRHVSGVLRRHVQDVGRYFSVYAMRECDVLWHAKCDNVERVHILSGIRVVVCGKPGTIRLQVRFRVLHAEHIDVDHVVQAVLAGNI